MVSTTFYIYVEPPGERQMTVGEQHWARARKQRRAGCTSVEARQPELRLRFRQHDVFEFRLPGDPFLESFGNVLSLRLSHSHWFIISERSVEEIQIKSESEPKYSVCRWGVSWAKSLPIWITMRQIGREREILTKIKILQELLIHMLFCPETAFVAIYALFQW